VGNDHVRILNIKTPRTRRLRFFAGQAVKLDIPDIASTTLHIASCPCDDMNLQFHVVKDEDNPFADYIFNQAKANDIVNIEGPVGHFVLHEDQPNPLIFIAFGYGITPIKSLIEHSLTLNDRENIRLYWVVQSEDDLYLHNQCRAWNDAFEGFIYTPIVANESLIDKLFTKHEKPDAYHYYIAGPAGQITATKNALLEQGVSLDSIFTEPVPG